MDFVKIDVEGFETNVLTGLQSTLTKFRPIIFIEWNQPNTTREDLAQHFPPNYEFHQFQAYVPMMKFFCQATYKLQSLNGNEPLPEGNYIAVPRDAKHHESKLALNR